MLPGDSDSELSGLDDDDDCENETEFFQSKDCAEVDDSIDDKGKESDIDDDSPGIAAKSKKRKKKNSEKSVFRWRNREPPVTNSDFKGAAISLPPQDFDQLTPFWYFTQFWDIDMTNHLVEQTNLYSVQKTGKSTNTNRKELEQLIGIMMKMGILCLDLKADVILTAATLRKNRLAGCKLLSNTELKQKGRGSFCFQTDQNTGLSIVKWYDNKPVHLVSTYIGVQADGTAEKASPAPRSAGRPPKRSMIFEEETTPKRGRVPKVALPDIDSRFDQSLRQFKLPTHTGYIDDGYWSLNQELQIENGVPLSSTDIKYFQVADVVAENALLRVKQELIDDKEVCLEVNRRLYNGSIGASKLLKTEGVFQVLLSEQRQ
eukprot:gene7117-12768_t